MGHRLIETNVSFNQKPIKEDITSYGLMSPTYYNLIRPCHIYNATSSGPARGLTSSGLVTSTV